MAYSIDFTAAFKASKTDIYSKAVDSPVSASEKNDSFRDSLKEAVRNESRNEIKGEERTALRKEIISKSESKLNGFKKLDNVPDEKFNPSDEKKEEKTESINITIEQMLLQLEELTKVQQQGEIPTEKQVAVLESIKETLAELGTTQLKGMETEAISLQTKAAELIAVLEGMQQELKKNGSLTDNNSIADFAAELKTLLAEELTKSEALTKSTDGIKSDYTPIKLETESNDKIEMKTTKAENSPVNKAAEQKTEKSNTMGAEDKQTSETDGSKNQEVKAAEPAAENKPINKGAQTAQTAQAASEESDEGFKTALGGKVDKVTVSDIENKKQEEEAGTDNEVNAEIPKAAQKVNSKPENADMSAIKLDQTVVDNKAEAVQRNTEISKPAAVNKTELINQIVKKAEIVFTDSQPEIRIQLEPENLGKLTLKLAVEKGLITAKFVAESYEVKQIIESGFNELKDMLQEKGLQVQNFSVSVGQEKREYNNNSLEQWKETVKLSARNMDRITYGGYLEGEGTPARTINPYNIHNGKFDYRA